MTLYQVGGSHEQKDFSRGMTRIRCHLGDIQEKLGVLHQTSFHASELISLS